MDIDLQSRIKLIEATLQLNLNIGIDFSNEMKAIATTSTWKRTAPAGSARQMAVKGNAGDLRATIAPPMAALAPPGSHDPATVNRTMSKDEEKDQRFDEEAGQLRGLKWVCAIVVLVVFGGVVYLMMNPLGNRFATEYETTTPGTTTHKYSYG